MLKIEKTVFISYRRANNIYIALAIYENLSKHGYDVFFDYESINSGDFEQIILQSIDSRAHFILILTPSALERCKYPEDWLLREIEHAIKTKRNIIPMTFEGFDFAEISRYLPDDVATVLSRYNGLLVPSQYFDEAMTRLRDRFLNIPTNAVLHPTTQKTQEYEEVQQKKLNAQPKVSKVQITAQEYFERAFRHAELKNYDLAIRDYSEAIRLNPEYVFAYNNRGNAYADEGKTDLAIRDYSEAIRLNPDDAFVYNNRGLAYADEGETDLAIRDYNEAIRLNPDDAFAYNNRGNAYTNEGKTDLAIRDYDEAIRLNSHFTDAYSNRGLAYALKGQADLAIHDCNEAIRLNPEDADVYSNRGNAYFCLKDYDLAIRDYSEAIRINPEDADVYNNRGSAHVKKRDYDLAIRDYQRVLQIDPDFQMAKLRLRVARNPILRWFFR